MSSQKKVESAVSDDAAALIREVFPRHPVKRLARLLSMPIGTAHEWVHRNMSAARRRELADALLAEFDRQEANRPAIRARLEDMKRGDL